ncbi:hypothetical protein GCM10009560_40280 [Nonomuraea longicatena]|uniref:Lipoprotein n=2 Tax=Nonomuraea longicatena TaxID=83682 RepID=A0ABN1PVF7_9ACTN
MPLRRWGTALTLTLLAGAASACSVPQERTPPAAPVQLAVPEPGEEARRLMVPFDAYNFSPAEIMTLEVAEDLLIRDCMQGRGLTWQALPGPPANESAPPNRRRYGVIEPRIVDVYGYRPPPDRPAVLARKTNDLAARITAAPPEVKKAAKRCLDQARDKLADGAPKADAGFFSRTIFASFDASKRDKKVVQAFRSWSTCMAGEGFRYPDPLAAITDARWGTKELSEKEIRTAQTDLRCKERSGLVAIWAAAENRIQNDIITAHPDKFRALKAVKEMQLSAARRVIAGK